MYFRYLKKYNMSKDLINFIFNDDDQYIIFDLALRELADEFIKIFIKKSSKTVRGIFLKYFLNNQGRQLRQPYYMCM